MGLSSQPDLLFLRGECGGKNNIEVMPGEVIGLSKGT